MHFTEAERLLDDAINDCVKLINDGIENKDEELSNKAYLLRTYCSMWKSISLFWRCAKSKGYNSAWNHLQDAIDRCDILSRNVSDGDRFNIKETAEYLLCYEKTFPYNVFLSPGFSSKSYCSICGKNSFDPECDHTPGKIYWGKMANIVVSAVKIHECSLVQSPNNKRNVLLNYSDSFFSNLQELFDYVEKPLNVVIYYEDRRHIDIDSQRNITTFNHEYGQ